MGGALLMAHESQSEAIGPGGKGSGTGGGKSLRQTVKVPRDLARKAKTIAILNGLSLEAYALDLLRMCSDRADEEITEKGAHAVRERAEAIDLGDTVMGTLNTTPEVATRLAMLAGQCLTSVAKLIHPYLKEAIEAGLRAVGGAWTMTPDGKEPLPRITLPSADAGGPGPSVEDARNFVIEAMRHKGYQTVVVPGDSLKKWGFEQGAVLVVNPHAAIEPGHTILVKAGGELTLRTIRLPSAPPGLRKVRGLPPLVDIETAKHMSMGTVLFRMTFAEPPTAPQVPG